MKILSVLFVLCFGATVVFGQADSVYKWYQVDSLPKLRVDGKVVEIKDYLYQNIRWNEFMNENEVMAVEYLVGSAGVFKVTSVLREPRSCSECAREMLETLKSIPRFEPAYKDGRAVSVSQTLVFRFEIQR